MANVGSRIRYIREKQNMSQEELAHKMGLKSRNSICKYENSNDMKLDTIGKFAEVLGCTPSFLMGWEDEFGNDICEVPEFSEDAMEVMEQYARLSEPNKVVVKNLINSLLIAEGK